MASRHARLTSATQLTTKEERAHSMLHLGCRNWAAFRHGVVMHLIAFLIFGLIVGAIARLIVPGTEPGGWAISLLLGVAGSLLGGFVGRALGLYQHGESAGFIVSLLGAIILVGIYHAFMRRRATTNGTTPGGWRPGRT